MPRTKVTNGRVGNNNFKRESPDGRTALGLTLRSLSNQPDFSLERLLIGLNHNTVINRSKRMDVTLWQLLEECRELTDEEMKLCREK
jgi:hypothetical protein